MKRSTKVVARVDSKWLNPPHDFEVKVSESGEILWTRSLGHIGYPKPSDAFYGFLTTGEVIETRTGLKPGEAEKILKKMFGKKGKKRMKS